MFLLLGGSYLLYTFVKVAVPIDLKLYFDTVILFCIPLIFMGDALHLHFSDIKKYGWSIFYLAVIAVALSIALGASLYYLGIFEGRITSYNVCYTKLLRGAIKAAITA